ncbi:hypothetical protein L211DRAFT_578231 [Terfezia boudieri ATCC MYA-4762]|uniref:Uncharacterized protein n=1 Tax=Terfezia boudieri ATCC MYA-4762 TaxID=1051890 RepID=A0A3N4LEZ6_9PEZI|nr:hypothetical protein L211DRAFT_578231 [Terfezia boudieri ATCC MYA-4762]
MRTFIFLVYSIMSLLYETVPAFEDTWIQYLGDVGRYRMAIECEDSERKDWSHWTNVSRSSYSEAADKKSTVGCLYHHSAILPVEKPNALTSSNNFFFYCKSLMVKQPFEWGRHSIRILFQSVLSNQSRSQPVNVRFVTLHEIWFRHIDLERFGGVI